MPTPAKVPTRLAGHEKALGGLLESLFREASDATGTRTGPPETAEAGGSADTPPASVRPPDGPVAAPRKTETAPEIETVRPVPWWAKGGFRALLFRIGEFRFGIPLVLMRGVFELPQRLTRVPAQPAWHLGLVRYRGQSVAVADFGPLVGVQARCRKPRYLLLVGDGRAAIACDEIENAAVVDPQAVRWARENEGGAWLAGLITQHMCGLLNADAVAEKIRHG